ncbi:Hypothetical predicted protein [Podarcis lilfordi]|uniref:Uncharacterized protein n=1 Tax=Podarcis lilfordi TaxID=74358 RepID=A0AA35JZY6_9SAUR|nr:Hypothetical predicted protein [Podarcis lilfordi]
MQRQASSTGAGWEGIPDGRASCSFPPAPPSTSPALSRTGTSAGCTTQMGAEQRSAVLPSGPAACCCFPPLRHGRPGPGSSRRHWVCRAAHLAPPFGAGDFLKVPALA